MRRNFVRSPRWQYGDKNKSPALPGFFANIFFD